MLVNVISDGFLHCVVTNWASGEDDHVVARAEFDFSAASEAEISLRSGDMINLAPKGEGVDHHLNHHSRPFDSAITWSLLSPFICFLMKLLCRWSSTVAQKSKSMK